MSAYNPAYSLAGFLVGILVGMTGVGGGSLMTPLLVLLFGFHPATAVGTDLLYASVTKSAGAAVHGKLGTIDWSIVTALGCGSVPASFLTLFVMSRLGTMGAGASGVLSLLLGIALLLTGVSVFLRPWILRWAGHHIHALPDRRLRRWTIVVGATVGALVSATSVGAGTLGTTALLIRCHLAPSAGEYLACGRAPDADWLNQERGMDRAMRAMRVFAVDPRPCIVAGVAT